MKFLSGKGLVMAAESDMRVLADIFVDRKKVGDDILGAIKGALESCGFEAFKTPTGNYAFKRRIDQPASPTRSMVLPGDDIEY